MSFAELHAISNFSFLRGASSPGEMVRTADYLGYEAIAITDECSFAGVVRAHQTIKDHELSVRLIVGSEFMIEDQCLVLLAMNREGYGQISQLITRARRRASKGEYEVLLSDFELSQQVGEERSLDQCLCIWRPSLDTLRNQDDSFATWLKAQFPGRCYQELNEFYENDGHLATQLALAELTQLPTVASTGALMHSAKRMQLRDVLMAMRLNTPVQEILPQLLPNAERRLHNLETLKHRFPEASLARTLEVAERCQFSMAELRYEYPTDLVPSHTTASQYLRALVAAGEQWRFPKGTPEDCQRDIARELDLIEQLQFEHFFITVWDLVRFAKSRSILCQGRGSAANSIVCYCLGITEVDPRKVSLLLERFISEDRSNDPPDIDVDFENARREEVIQYIYERYGRHRAAIAATVIRFKFKSATREVAKALGMNVDELEGVIQRQGLRYRPNWHLDLVDEQSLGSRRQLQLYKELVEQVVGFPRHLSQHVGGFVIAKGELAELVPIENAAMEDRTVIQWDKDDLESLGLLKVDVLALGMMTAIQYALQYLSWWQNQPFTLADIPREDDPVVYEMLCNGDSVGVFQVESRAQMNMLPRLKPECYYDLVVQVAIVRPGPIAGDMVHPYLKRRHGEEPEDYPTEELRGVLERTYGVPIFQEQVIAMAMVAADFTPGEADTLRRSMASWKKTGHMHKLMDKLVQRMSERGYERSYIDRICRQMEGFGEYGFPESHAASFALLVYFSAWLKCYHPAFFLCGLLNAQPMGFYTPSQLIQDSQRPPHNVQVLPVCINRSQWLHQIEAMPDGKPGVRLGFRIVKGLKEEFGEALAHYRPESGYRDYNQVAKVPGSNSRMLEALASVNAFKEITENRFQAHWDIATLGQVTELFQQAEMGESVYLGQPDPFEEMSLDYQGLGLSLQHHPMAQLRETELLAGHLRAVDLPNIAHETQVTVSGVVTCRQRPGTASGVTFVTLEDETGNSNVVVWQTTAHQFLQTLVTASLLKVEGRLERDATGKVIHIIAYRLFDLSTRLQLNKSRDYH